MFVAEQQPDGRWIDHEDYFPTTCFALMFLTRSLPKPMQPDLGAVNRSLRYSRLRRVSATLCGLVSH